MQTTLTQANTNQEAVRLARFLQGSSGRLCPWPPYLPEQVPLPSGPLGSLPHTGWSVRYPWAKQWL